MQIKSLKDTPFTEIMECLFLAFQNYYVDLPKDHGYYMERWRMANVNYDLSYGAFHQDKLVGFVLNAIDSRNGSFTAYNACTGVLPEFRGKKMVKSIYDHALPILKSNGVERCTLEVITKNIRAINAYKAVGFEINKNYKCFRGNLNLGTLQDYELHEDSFNAAAVVKSMDQSWYSWENHTLTIAKGNYRYFEILFQGNVESYFVIAPHGGYVPQMEVLVNHPDVWNRLWAGLGQISEAIKVNNVDTRLTEKIIELQKSGLENYLDQYEMELAL